MTFRESDGRIVPLKSGLQPDRMKPSNIGAGKAARRLRDRDRAPSVLRDGTAVLTWLDRSFRRVFVDHRRMLPRACLTYSNVVMAQLRIVFCPEPPEAK
jgi:hypothetical protein